MITLLHLAYKGKPLLINLDHVMRVRNSIEAENPSGSTITFVGGSNQEIDENSDQVIAVMGTKNLLLG